MTKCSTQLTFFPRMVSGIYMHALVLTVSHCSVGFYGNKCKEILDIEIPTHNACSQVSGFAHPDFNVTRE